MPVEIIEPSNTPQDGDQHHEEHSHGGQPPHEELGATALPGVEPDQTGEHHEDRTNQGDQQDDGHDDHEGRWDIDKARKMAEITEVEHHAEGQRSRHDDRYDYLKTTVSDSGIPEQVRGEVRDMAVDRLQTSGDRLSRVVNGELKPYEEFYDSNPKYANIPTKQFLEEARLYMGFVFDIEVNSKALELIETSITNLDADLHDGNRAPGRNVDMDNVGTLIAGALGFDNEAYSKLNDEIKAIYEDSYEKSPRKIDEQKRAFVGLYAEKIRSRIDEMNKRREQILEGNRHQAEQPAESQGFQPPEVEMPSEEAI